MATQKAAKQATQVRARRPTPQGQPTAPTYEVLERSYIDNRLVEAGQTVQYWGVPGKFLKPLNAAAKANKLAARDTKANNKDPEDRASALRELDNDLQNVVSPDSDDGFDPDGELTDAERKELEGHAATTAAQTKAEHEANPNAVPLVMTGDPNDPEGKLARAHADAKAAAEGKETPSQKAADKAK